MKKPPERWLHIEAPMGNPWALPIYTAMGEDRRSDRINKLGLAISDRLTFLRIICERLLETERNIYAETNEYEEKYIYTNDNEGYAYRIDEMLKWKFIINLHSYLFELNATCDLMKDFIEAVYKVANQKIPNKNTGIFIAKILNKNNLPTEWFQLLDNARNYFIHESSAYFAIDISNDQHDILIMKENVDDFNDPDTYFLLSDLKNIYSNFVNSLYIIQNHLIDLF